MAAPGQASTTIIVADGDARVPQLGSFSAKSAESKQRMLNANAACPNAMLLVVKRMQQAIVSGAALNQRSFIYAEYDRKTDTLTECNIYPDYEINNPSIGSGRCAKDAEFKRYVTECIPTVHIPIYVCTGGASFIASVLSVRALWGEAAHELAKAAGYDRPAGAAAAAFPTAEEQQRICNNTACGSREDAKLSRCSRCLTAYYCSRECQAIDWAIHKKWCQMPA